MKTSRPDKSSTPLKKDEPEAAPPGVNIRASRDVNIGGNVAGGNMTVNQNNPSESNKTISAKSSWANGLFYLFIFVVVAGILGWLSSTLPLSTLVVIVLAGLLAIPLVGALQLRMDKRLSEKSFLALMKMTIAQVPLIGNLFSNKNLS